MTPYPRILIVEETTAQARRCLTRLRALGADAEIAGNFFEAICLFNTRYARRRPFELIITRYALPGPFTGPALARVFLNLHTPLKVTLIPHLLRETTVIRRECSSLGNSLVQPEAVLPGLKAVLNRLAREIPGRSTG